MNLEYLARATQNEILLGNIGVFIVQFLIAALILHLIAESIRHIPYLAVHMGSKWGQLLVFLVILGLALALAYYLPTLRILHRIGIIYSVKNKMWLDIILSGIALSRSTYFWNMLIRWLDRRSSS